VVDAVPTQLRESVPALTQLADHASIDALNAMVTLGTVIGAVSVVLAVITFAVDRRRVRRQAREPGPPPL
jgi:hypothetical protein